MRIQNLYFSLILILIAVLQIRNGPFGRNNQTKVKKKLSIYNGTKFIQQSFGSGSGFETGFESGSETDQNFFFSTTMFDAASHLEKDLLLFV